MKKLKTAVSFVAILAMLATMFTAPLGVSAANESIIYSYTGMVTSGSSSDAPTTFKKCADTSVKLENGTLVTPNYYFSTGKNLYGGAGDMTVGYTANGTDNSKSVLTFIDLNSNFIENADSNTRIVYEININPTKTINNMTLMMRDAGVSITSSLVTSFSYGKWQNIKIYYNPTVTYEYTKTSETTSEQKSVTTNLLTNFLIVNNKDESKAEELNNYWKSLLGNEYEDGCTYAFRSVTYGDCDVYVDGVHKGHINGLKKSNNLEYISATIPGRISFNTSSPTSLYYSNASVKAIENCTPAAPTMSPFAENGKYTFDTNNIYIKSGTKLSDIELNEGYDMAAYTDTTAGGSYPTVANDGVLAAGNTIMVREITTYQMRGYTVCAQPARYSENDFALMTSESPSNMGSVKSTLTWETGIGGKDAADRSLKITKKSGTNVDNDAYITFNYTRNNENYLIFKFNILASSSETNLTKFRIGENSHSNLGTDIDMATDNKWHEITNIIHFVSDTDNAEYTTYLDGKLIGNGKSKTADISKKGLRQLRIIVFGAEKDKTFSAYLDDLVIYRSNTAPTVTPQELTNTFDGDIKITNGNTMYIPTNTTVAAAKEIVKKKYATADIKAINGYKISANNALADTATLSDEDVIVYETTDDGINGANLKTYSYVTVKAIPENAIIAESTSATANEVITAQAFTNENTYIIVAAEYDKDGNMINIDYNSTGTISITPNTAGNTVRVYLVDNLSNIKPLADNIELSVR